MSKHVKLHHNFGVHNAGESCSLSDHEADFLINQGKAELAPIPEGNPRSAAIPAEPASLDINEVLLREQDIKFREHLTDVRSAHVAKVDELTAQITALQENAKTTSRPVPSVRAKFKCVAKEADPSVEDQVHLKFLAVYEDEGVNKTWSKWTPAGDLTMSITNPSAHAKFEVGKEYFLDFTPAE